LGVLCGELPSRRSIVETTKLATRRALFAAAAAILVLAPVALAAKGGNGPKGSNSTSSSSLTLQLVTDVNNDGPSWGDMVRFSVSNPPADPNVELLCSQNDTVVYSSQTGYLASTWPLTGDMVLKSQDWSGGPASCTARLYVFSGAKTTTLATLSFSATA